MEDILKRWRASRFMGEEMRVRLLNREIKVHVSDTTMLNWKYVVGIKKKKGKNIKMVEKLLKNKWWWMWLSLLFVAVIYVASLTHFRIDLTREKRFSLSNST
jgi:hypothetical protein